jgi:HK97 family phage major capsid protein
MKFKAFLATKGITDESFKTMDVSEQAKLHMEFLDSLDSVSSKEFEDIKTQLKTLETNGATAEQLKSIEAQLKELKDASVTNSVEEVKSMREQIKEQILANTDEFGKLKTEKSASFGLVIKAPADMLISTNTTGRVARQDREVGTNRIVRRRPFVLDNVTVSPTNGNTLYWVDQVNPDGTPAMTAEGATKAQIDWDYIERSTPVRKITAFTKVSKEMLDDIDGFASDIEAELTERILLIADGQALTGDGTGQNIVGISVNATPFAGGALANAVADANDIDVLRAGVAQVYRQEFVPNKIFIHPDKAALMDLQKGTDGHYLLAPFVTADGMNVRGVMVETNTGVGADDFYVGDFTKYKFKVRENISIQIGYDGNDWTKNMVTPLAEMRGAGYISSTNYGAIVKGTFTVAKALLDPDVADS